MLFSIWIFGERRIIHHHHLSLLDLRLLIGLFLRDNRGGVCVDVDQDVIEHQIGIHLERDPSFANDGHLFLLLLRWFNVPVKEVSEPIRIVGIEHEGVPLFGILGILHCSLLSFFEYHPTLGPAIICLGGDGHYSDSGVDGVRVVID